ncbi:ferritin-like protein [Mobiluncus mulieris ATCC 35239]|uniref:Ferritin-like protein n=3 Tax=Mobiluncus mulieris TaxID=2052 RepID=E0QQ40_9ACTO|nr:DNA starvation/stationary phase protection protein [Mobiluncus mulieris]EFM46420.1 ferritin-like protein [Mobiluncus mulieris ATCC 35239]MCU9975366.1 DNA starvation/stationary phase protection protein [Mobiluncus mulieris]MCU9993133.1 DNA starvation/stationary phase protection protein [Mobiluncus mulieris]MCV0013303.1 DNA starvation/stationary phase protection protein [Mobiluncus mulieris]NMW63058.1 DNA starvation/stationary phase protection protein [Mobiluncus mulieris]
MKNMSNKVVEDALQQGLVDLNALALQGKQIHWNLEGEGFQVLHEFLDTIITLARTSYDDLAERLVAIGGQPDGRAKTIADTTVLKPLDKGYIQVKKGYEVYEAALMAVSNKMKEFIPAVDDVDPLSSDLLIGTARELEKQAWFLRAHLGRLGK